MDSVAIFFLLLVTYAVVTFTGVVEKIKNFPLAPVNRNMAISAPARIYPLTLHLPSGAAVCKKLLSIFHKQSVQQLVNHSANQSINQSRAQLLPFFFFCISGYWIFGAEFCDTWVAFDVMCSTASILNLCAISMDRYIHIKDPLR